MRYKDRPLDFHYFCDAVCSRSALPTLEGALEVHSMCAIPAIRAGFWWHVQSGEGSLGDSRDFTLPSATEKRTLKVKLQLMKPTFNGEKKERQKHVVDEVRAALLASQTPLQLDGQPVTWPTRAAGQVAPVEYLLDVLPGKSIHIMRLAHGDRVQEFTAGGSGTHSRRMGLPGPTANSPFVRPHRQAVLGPHLRGR